MIAQHKAAPASAPGTRTILNAWWAAVQFLTRIPTPCIAWTEDTLARSVVFFPVVGLLLGAAAAGLDRLLTPHLPALLTALLTVGFCIAATGALHEDGLADCADAFGSQHSLERTLAILKDSRIGVYGAVALVVSLAARVLLIAAIPQARILPCLVVATTLSRWAILPLTRLPSANPGAGSGSAIAQRTSRTVHITGFFLMLLIAAFCLHRAAIVSVLAASLVVLACGAFFKQRLGGTTGDCFGATVQLVEIAVLFCGAWH
jgi:adenosylcobinamide-GDP ribazoletransferase